MHVIDWKIGFMRLKIWSFIHAINLNCDLISMRINATLRLRVQDVLKEKREETVEKLKEAV